VTYCNGSYADKESQLTYVSIVETIKYIVKAENYTYQNLLLLIDGIPGFIGYPLAKRHLGAGAKLHIKRGMYMQLLM